MASPPRAHASVSSVVHYYRLSPGPNAPGEQDLASRRRVHNTQRYEHPIFGLPGLPGWGEASINGQVADAKSLSATYSSV
jgi:hypothetical protein